MSNDEFNKISKKNGYLRKTVGGFKWEYVEKI